MLRQVTNTAILILGCAWVVLPVPLSAQSSKVITVTVTEGSLDEILYSISSDSDVPVVFSSDQLPEVRKSIQVTGTTRELLAQALKDTGLKFELVNGLFVVVPENITMPDRKITGLVTDDETGEVLAGAHIWNPLTGRGTSTDSMGRFILMVSQDVDELSVSYLGYEDGSVAIGIDKTQEFDVQLNRSVKLDEIVIYSQADRADDVFGTDRHTIIPTDQPSSLGLGGVVDLQQLATKLPGVATGTDGVGGLNVRGGSYDQNLVLLDGAPVYSPTHAAGIVSIVNPQVLKQASLDKGIYSARHSGRLSSVMDIYTKAGDLDKWGLSASVGPLSVDGVVEGPVIPGKLSILVAGRAFLPTSYIRTITEREKANNGLSGETSYSYYDINARLRFKASESDVIDLIVYNSNDSYEDLTQDVTLFDDSRFLKEYDRSVRWGNLLTSLRWNRYIGNQGISTVTVALSNFELQSLDNRRTVQTFFNPRVRAEGFANLEFKSIINDVTLKWDYTHRINERFRISGGTQFIQHTLKPKSVAFTDAFRIEQFEVDEATLDDALFANLYRTNYEYGVYGQGDWQITPKLSTRVGLHLAGFSGREVTFINPQPRIQLAYDASDFVKIEASFGSSVQYLHLLTNSGIGLPTDLWVPSTASVEPQKSWQAALGTQWSLPLNASLGWSLFYRSMENLTQYEEGASFLLSEGTVESSIVDATDWEKKVVQGSGYSMGSEWSLSVPYSKGAFTADYTLSKSVRQFDELNGGEEFPFRFDRTHNLNLNGTWKISKVISASATWVYGSGTPVTLTESVYKYQDVNVGLVPTNIDVLVYRERNGYRLPAYHRLDLAMSATWEKPKLSHTISVMIYNAYNRRNVAHVTLTENETTGGYTYQQYTVLPVIPSISYKISL